MSDADIVTLLFTDLVGSTELLERVGDDAAERVRRTHFGLLREAVASRCGEEVKNLGDGLMVVFPSAVEAVGCAVAIQQAVARHNQETGAVPFEVRVGLHVGEPVRDEGDYFGKSVVVAKRLCDAADGGQILASELVQGLVGSRGGHSFRPLGLVTLKGLAEPLATLAVDWERPGAAAALPVALASARGPFVGRQDELKRLRAAWAEAEAGRRQLVLVSGEPGIGKSRLAAELGREVLAAGAVVLYGRCDEDAVVPYQPFVEALRNLVASDFGRALPTPAQRTELARLVPELAAPGSPAPASSDPEGDRYRFFEAIASVLAAASRRRPVLLVLDDLHWAAKPTLLLLRHLLQAQEPTALLLLGTYREGELTRSHPLTDLLGTLRREGLYERIPLRGLSPFEVSALLEDRAGQQLTPDGVALSDTLSQETAGNPFFIAEILRRLTETGGVAVRDGCWVTSGLGDLDIPEGVRDVIGRRLSRLSEAANTALGHAAVLGREFEFDVLAAMADVDDDTLLSAVEDALAAGLIAEVPGAAVSTYAFTQTLAREALLTEISRARLERMHLRAARAIEAVYPGRTDARAGVLAHHYRHASRPGVPEKAIEYSVKAGEAAARALAWEEVAGHWQAALHLMEEEGDDPERRARLLERLAELMYVAGFDLALGIAYSEKALVLYEELGQEGAAARMHSRLGHYLTTFPEVMDIPRALRHFRAAEASMAPGPASPALGYVYVGLGAAGWWGMHSEDGLAAHRRAAEIGQALGEEALRASGAGGEGWHRAARGAFAAGEEQVEQTWEIGDQLNHRFLAFYGAWGRGVLALLALDPADAAAWFERELARPRLAQAPMQRRLLEGELATARLLAGRLDEARRLPEPNGLSVFLPAVAFFEGDWEGAVATLGSASERAERAGNRWHQWALGRAAAQACRVQGHHQRAEELLGEALAIALESGYGMVEAWLRTDLVVTCVELNRSAEAHRHLARGRELLAAGENWRGPPGVSPWPRRSTTPPRVAGRQPMAPSTGRSRPSPVTTFPGTAPRPSFFGAVPWPRPDPGSRRSGASRRRTPLTATAARPGGGWLASRRSAPHEADDVGCPDSAVRAVSGGRRRSRRPRTSPSGRPRPG